MTRIIPQGANDASSVLIKHVSDNFPRELRDLAQWVVWRFETRQGQDKPTKVLYNLATGQRADSTNPATWGTFDNASATFTRGGYAGVGFVVTADDPYVGVDLDGCIVDGQLGHQSRPLPSRPLRDLPADARQTDDCGLHQRPRLLPRLWHAMAPHHGTRILSTAGHRRPQEPQQRLGCQQPLGRVPTRHNRHGHRRLATHLHLQRRRPHSRHCPRSLRRQRHHPPRRHRTPPRLHRRRHQRRLPNQSCSRPSCRHPNQPPHLAHPSQRLPYSHRRTMAVG